MADFEYASEVTMTPDSTVVWEVRDCPELGGAMIIAPNCDPAIIDALRKVAVAKIEAPDALVGPQIGKGGNGVVTAWPRLGLALKANYPFKAPHAGYEDLKANVTLSEGLQRIRSMTNTPVTYIAPTYYSAYYPYRKGGRGVGIIAMSHESGKNRSALSDAEQQRLPRPDLRRRVYRRALAACGAHPNAIDLDITRQGRGIENELFRFAIPITEETDMADARAALTVVKLDIGAKGLDPHNPFEMA